MLLLLLWGVIILVEMFLIVGVVEEFFLMFWLGMFGLWINLIL